MRRPTYFYYPLHTLYCLIVMVIILFSSISYSQNPEWLNYTSGKNVKLIIDDNDYLWIGGIGLTRLTKDTGEMVFYNKSNSGLPMPRIRALAKDKSGNLWIGTWNYGASGWGGLTLFDGTNWQVYNQANSNLPSDQINDIVIDDYNNKWIATAGGLVKFDGVNWTVYNIENSGLPSNDISALDIDQWGNIWMAMGGLSAGPSCVKLARFDGLNWTVYQWDAEIAQIWVEVYTLVIDDQGNKWIGMNCAAIYGLFKFDGNNWTLPPYISDYCVKCIAIDQDGNLWFGLLIGDLIKYDGMNYTIYDHTNSILPAFSTINTVVIDKNNNKWLGLESDGLIKYDNINWSVFNIGNCGLPDDDVKLIAVDDENNKWFVTDNCLTKYDGFNWTVYNENNTGLSFKDIRDITIDRDGDVWMGGTMAG